MPCSSPNAAVRLPGKTVNGKQRIKIFGKALASEFQAQQLLECGQCIHCRLEKSREWAIRIMQQTKFHEENSFLTLTYDEDHVPLNGSLIRTDIQTFFKDLRSRLDYCGEGKIKFFYVGEYGEKSSRPHYHAIIFGGSFQRAIGEFEANEEERARSGGPQYSHGLLSEVWPHGLHRISEVSFESAAYVARYALKKVTGALKEAHYGDRTPEFSESSNGLGKGHFEAWKEDIYPHDKVVIPGRGEFQPPRYYDRLLEKADPDMYVQVQAQRADREPLEREDYFRKLYERYVSNLVKQRLVKETLVRSI